ncbi:MAG: DUF3261 domain-containing protein [Deltaproteobacteria bacterium]|nr:DUF3261 domain-containing protein [Deltaproteobacteria bacterium]
MRCVCRFALVLSLVGCGPAIPQPEVEARGERTVFRLRHQIMVRYDDEVQVFEGYMILEGESFLVKAFAGPGIDLFTVRRDGARHVEEAHVPGLADKLDLERVGADIARAYLGGCGALAGGGSVECSFYGEPMREQYDDRGRLLSRTFPAAHDIGLSVRYADYSPRVGRELAGAITLSWGKGENEMVIHLLDAQLLEDFDASRLAIP